MSNKTVLVTGGAGFIGANVVRQLAEQGRQVRVFDNFYRSDADTVAELKSLPNVEIVEGDVVETVCRLAEEDLVLSFVDTDNFTSAEAIIRVIAERTVVGGAVVFDHWTGHDRHIDTIGERMAARRLAADGRYFNLHGTGVFLRQI